VNIFQKKLEVETSKEVLLQTILDNKENLDTNLIAIAIKDYVKNYNKFDEEKKKLLEFFSESKN